MDKIYELRIAASSGLFYDPVRFSFISESEKWLDRKKSSNNNKYQLSIHDRLKNSKNRSIKVIKAISRSAGQSRGIKD